jgi:RNA recognition motif-containing protein
MKNIYVGNLPFSATEADIEQLFAEYGKVDRVSIVIDRETGRSRGFGFVEMGDDAEGDAAINAINGMEMGGRRLVVNEARPREQRAGGFGGGGGGRGGYGGGGGGGRGGYGGGGGGGGRGGYGGGGGGSGYGGGGRGGYGGGGDRGGGDRGGDRGGGW